MRSFSITRLQPRSGWRSKTVLLPSHSSRPLRVMKNHFATPYIKTVGACCYVNGPLSSALRRRRLEKRSTNCIMPTCFPCLQRTGAARHGAQEECGWGCVSLCCSVSQRHVRSHELRPRHPYHLRYLNRLAGAARLEKSSRRSRLKSIPVMT